MSSPRLPSFLVVAVVTLACGGGSSGGSAQPACSAAADCDDHLSCNGAESCVGGRCVAGTPIACDDGVACTRDACDEAAGACTHTPEDGRCGAGEQCDATSGCVARCQVRTCQGHVFQCGDCLDDDGDGKTDADDPECLGACDNSEDSYFPALPGTPPACQVDCYFDQDFASGNDDCHWSHACDPLEVAPDYPPEGSQCAYDANARISGTTRTCSEAVTAQSAACLAYCGPLTPNGCDCFGCCAIPGAPTPVWLGSVDASGNGTCTPETLADAARCRPCTQVTACLEPCEHCTLCVGKTTLPADCAVQTCPADAAPCGLPGQAACAEGMSCITGCCQPNVQ